jgi:DNA-directed RNA polymerase specialized sigma24 family protein
MTQKEEWLLEGLPRIYGFATKNLYGRDNIGEVVSRTCEKILTNEKEFENKEKFISYCVKISQYEIIHLMYENKGYLKYTMKDRHPEKLITFTRLKGDNTDKHFMEVLDKYSSRNLIGEECLTEVGKKELLKLVFPLLKKLHYSIIEERLHGTSLFQIGKKLGKTQKQVEDMVYSTIIPKLKKVLKEKAGE